MRLIHHFSATEWFLSADYQIVPNNSQLTFFCIWGKSGAGSHVDILQSTVGLLFEMKYQEYHKHRNETLNVNLQAGTTTIMPKKNMQHISHSDPSFQPRLCTKESSPISRVIVKYEERQCMFWSLLLVHSLELYCLVNTQIVIADLDIKLLNL